MSVFNTAGNRAIMIGIALGIVSTSIRFCSASTARTWGRIDCGRLLHTTTGGWWPSSLRRSRRSAGSSRRRIHAATLRTLDRRWIFLLMFWSVLVPIYYIGVTGQTFPEVPSALAQATFDEIDRLEPGDPVLLSFDYDPASEGELGPMATAFVKHAAAKHLKMYFMALWPVGVQMVDNTIAKVITADYPELVYGRDYVNLGFKSGNEGVIKVIVNQPARTVHDRQPRHRPAGTADDARHQQHSADEADHQRRRPGIRAPRSGCSTRSRRIPTRSGSSPADRRAGAAAYPYVPRQLAGLLGAIKGAAEYEKLVIDAVRRA